MVNERLCERQHGTTRFGPTWASGASPPRKRLASPCRTSLARGGSCRCSLRPSARSGNQPPRDRPNGAQLDQPPMGQNRHPIALRGQTADRQVGSSRGGRIVDPARELSLDLRRVAAQYARAQLDDGPQQRVLDSILDGGVRRLYEGLVPAEFRRTLGVYFTPSHLAFSIAAGVPASAAVFDPSTGAGDLLLACSARLTVQRSLEATLSKWGALLGGFEIQPSLVDVAKTRLLLAAMRRGSMPSRIESVQRDWFPHIRVADFMSAPRRMPENAAVVMNPPFGSEKPARRVEWAGGRVSRAALHLEHVLDISPANTPIAALLPDVLRSGSRYRRWRDEMAQRLLVSSLQVHGRFSDSADVDVFQVRGVTRGSRLVAAKWRHSRRGGKTVGDAFELRVGPLVPHRHGNLGTRRRFADARSVRPWAVQTRLGTPRGFAGPCFEPPFVVFRRTSSPSDRERPVASVIGGKTPVAVENHLIVAIPRSGRKGDCLQLLEALHDKRARRSLDREVRCRHLTVGSVAALPFDGEPK